MASEQRPAATTTARHRKRSRLLTVSLMILVGALALNRGRIVEAVHDVFAPPAPPPSTIIIVAPEGARTV
jgi:hypothetical protein